MALRQRSLAGRIHVWARRVEVRASCSRLPWCDAAFASVADAVTGSDLVVVCAPVDHITALAREAAARLAEGALITDVGSTKSLICRSLEGGCGKAGFIGSHPMAGSEKTGMEHASASLFVDRACIVTPLESAVPDDVERVIGMWNGVGMRVSCLAPEAHDEMVAHISHLPHLLASALAVQLRGRPDCWGALSGQGLRDVTRIAAGSPQLWTAIARENREEILRAIDSFDQQLGRLRSLLHNEDYHSLHHFLSQGKAFRDSL
jgi:prephenate dehydrogenase